MPINLDLHALREEMDRAGHGQKRAVILRYAKALGVSPDTIYRAMRREFGKRKTKTSHPRRIPDELIDMVADIKLKGMKMGLKERELSTENCIQMLIEQGVEGAEHLTPSTVNRRLVERGFRIRDPKVRVEAKYANQEHQIDFSRSKYFQVTRYDPQRNDYLMRVSGKELHYKKNDRRLRTWLVQLKDSYSRVRILQAYAATGESALMGLEFLNFCYNRPEDDNPLRYVPDMLKSDSGAFEKKKEVRAALQALQIEPRRSRPYNKDSQGKVESGFRSVWGEFELKLAIKMGSGARIYLSEYNELLMEFCIEDMQKKHPFQDDTREAAYRKSLLIHPPREIDIDLLQVACKVEYRTVPQTLMVQYGGQQYEAPVYAMGKRIRIYRNMLGELMGELQEEDRKPFILQPFRYREIDDFEHRPHSTYRQQREQAIKQTEQKETKRIFFPPKPEKVQPESPFSNVDQETAIFPNIYTARAYIGAQLRALGATYADYADIFDPLLQEDLSRESIDAVLKEIKKFFRNAVGL